MIALPVFQGSCIVRPPIFNPCIINHYRPQRSCGKVMLLHLSVSHSVHRGGVPASVHAGIHPRQAHPWAGTFPPPDPGFPRGGANSNNINNIISNLFLSFWFKFISTCEFIGKVMLPAVVDLRWALSPATPAPQQPFPPPPDGPKCS